MNILSLSYVADDDWHGELAVHVVADGFDARASAWFSLDRIYAFLNAMNAIPIEESSAPLLEGGTVHEVHVGLRIVPHNRTGTLRVECRLASRASLGPGHVNLYNTLRLYVLTTYGDLQSFQAELRKMLAGGQDSAELHLRGMHDF